MKSNILAVDLGTHLGWALDLPRGITSGVSDFSPSKGQGWGLRFLQFTNFLNTLSNNNPIRIVYFEDVRAHNGVVAAHVYGGFKAHLLAWCERTRIPYYGVNVRTIKQHATGTGKATKSLMIQSMRGLGFYPKDDNEADALALLMWAKEHGQ